MSHELRTPINAALGYADLMALGIRGPVTDAQQEDLARLRRSQQRLLNLVNDVLSFARIESGRIEYRTTDVPLDEVLAGAEALVAPLLRAKGLGYEYRPVDEALLVRADRERLEQILVNLLSNAVKFTDAGGRVTVSAEATERAVRVCVTDSGRGIPADKLEAIFEPFVQVEQGLTRSAEGTGLGLAISREMARAMGSDLTAVSTVGVGSTFTLTLPRSGVRAFLEPPSPPPAGAADGRRDGTVPERGSADPT
jgi:signal transduction histidine kinase